MRLRIALLLLLWSGWAHSYPETGHDSLYLFRIVRLADGQFPQRLHRALARRRIDHVAPVALPPLQTADRQPGQYSAAELPAAGGGVPSLRKPHPLALSGH